MNFIEKARSRSPGQRMASAVGFLGGVMRDVRFTMRALRRSLAFAAVAVSSIAIGIGATTAVFSIVDLILFRSLPYSAGDRLVSVGMTIPIIQQEFMFSSSYYAFKKDQTPFEAVTSWTGIDDCDLTEQNAVRLSCASVESNFLSTFGIAPVFGRNFTDEEDQPAAPKVALLTYGLWSSRFGSNPEAIGKTITLDGQQVRVLGVLPRTFQLPNLERADLLVPEALNKNPQGGPGRVVRVFARLRGHVSIQQAIAMLQPLFQRFRMGAPPNFRKEIGLRVHSLRDYQVENLRVASWLLLSGVLAVLLVACLNVANLSLARGIQRTDEISIRLALGAQRFRIVQQLLTESFVLAGFGAVAGVILAFFVIRIARVLGPDDIPQLRQAALDGRVLVFTLLLCGVAALICGLAPAFRTVRLRPFAGSKSGKPSGIGVRKCLVALEIGMSIVLFTCAGLLLRSLRNMERVPLGFGEDHVMTLSLTLGQQHYPTPVQQLAFFDRLEEQVLRRPGTEAVALTDSVPPGGPVHTRPYSVLRVPGQTPPEAILGGAVAWRSVTPGYFGVLRIPILRGRVFQESDRGPGQDSIVLSRALAQKLFGNSDPLYQRIDIESRSYVVIGVVADVKNSGVTEQEKPEFYITRKHRTDDAIFQYPDASRRVNIVVRSSTSERDLGEWLRSEVASIDPRIPVQIQPLSDKVERFTARAKFNAVFLGGFASTALVIATLGAYGLLVFLMAQRTKEIAIRMAVGATRQSIIKMVFIDAASWTGAGAATGVVGSIFAARLLSASLFHVSRYDPQSLICAVCVLSITALLAAAIASRRAIQINPTQALRQE